MLLLTYHYQSKTFQKKKQVNKLFLKPKPEIEVGIDGEYKVETIRNSAVYANKVAKKQ